MILVFIAMAFILIRQIFELQIIQGENYISEFENRITKTRVLKSTRGNIYDRNGEMVASNILSYSLTFEDNGSYETTREKNLTLNGVAYRVLQILSENGDSLSGDFHIVLDENGNNAFVELATVSFGQSFQITPVQLATTVSSLINGGNRITPHFGVAVQSADGTQVKELEYPVETGIVSSETSETVRKILETVVSEGSGKNAAIEGYSIGGKTATSQTLPRSANRYISSFLGFAPAEEPKVLALCIIHDPQGIYYGGTIAAPVVRSIFDNVLPYLGIEKTKSEKSEEDERSLSGQEEQ